MPVERRDRSPRRAFRFARHQPRRALLRRQRHQLHVTHRRRQRALLCDVQRLPVELRHGEELLLNHIPAIRQQREIVRHVFENRLTAQLHPQPVLRFLEARRDCADADINRVRSSRRQRQPHHRRTRAGVARQRPALHVRGGKRQQLPLALFAPALGQNIRRFRPRKIRQHNRLPVLRPATRVVRQKLRLRCGECGGDGKERQQEQIVHGGDESWERAPKAATI